MGHDHAARHVRVLGIDPGLTRCGLGVVDGPTGRPVHRHHETVRTSASSPLPERLATVFETVTEAIERWRPDVVAVERVLFSNNVRTAMATGQAAGVVLLAAARADVVVREITPTRVKATVAGHGGADKDAVARMVTAQLRLDEQPRPADAADALAVALSGLVATVATTARDGAADGTGNGGGAAGSWEDHLATRGLRVVGGTPAGDGRGRSGTGGRR